MTRTVGQAMTPAPFCVSADAPLTEAHRLMAEGKLRHLPVVAYANRLVGVISERDLFRIESSPDVNPRSVEVCKAMSSPPFWVVPETPLAVVAAQMHARRIGCAVVVDEAEVVGIFTGTDALAELAAPLRPDGDGPWAEDRA